MGEVYHARDLWLGRDAYDAGGRQAEHGGFRFEPLRHASLYLLGLRLDFYGSSVL